MLLIPRAVRVYFASAPVSLRRSFEGLSNEVREVLAPRSAQRSRLRVPEQRRNQVKLLVWTRGGFTIVHKRLERGTFRFPARVTSEAPSVPLDVHELSMLLEGIDVARARTSARAGSRRAHATSTDADLMPSTIDVTSREFRLRALRSRRDTDDDVSDATLRRRQDGERDARPVLEVLRELLAERRDAEVLALVAKLVARNSELERRLAQLLRAATRTRACRAAQLELLLDALDGAGRRRRAGAPISRGRQKLRTAQRRSTSARRASDQERTTRPQAAAAVCAGRLPPELRRVENPIAVPAAERRVSDVRRASARASATT